MKYLIDKKSKLFLLILIAFLSNSKTTLCQKPISEETAFLWKLKLDSLPVQDHTEEYLYRFEKENYRLFKNDEFEMHKAEKKLNEMVEALPQNEVYTIIYNTELAGYDFEKKGFYCTPVEEGKHLQLLDFSFGTRLPTNSSVELQFLNVTEIDILPVDEEKASVFVKERKNYKTGKIDRSITLNISFIINGTYKVENVTSKSNYTLTANILQIEFFDDNELTHDPLGIVTTSFKAEIDEKSKLEKEHNEMKSKLASGENTPKEGDSDLIIDIKNILSNSTLNNELKATLIKSTIDLYQDKQETASTQTN